MTDIQDIGRDYLIMRLQCAECGHLLKMSYDPPKKKSSDYAKGMPTGASMVGKNVTVYPCNCTLVAERELADLRRLLTPKKEAA